MNNVEIEPIQRTAIADPIKRIVAVQHFRVASEYYFLTPIQSLEKARERET